MSELSAAGLNRATLARQQLLERGRFDVVDGVRALGPLQAQHPASPYLALAARIDGFEPADLDAAIANGHLIKASLIRITLHLAHRDDLALFRAAMLPSLRAAGLNDRRFRETGLTVDDADELVDLLAEFAREPRTRPEVVEHLETRTGTPVESGLWRALRLVARWHHACGDHVWSFGEPARFQTLPGDVVDPAEPLDQIDAVGALLHTYLAAFGPATLRDVAQFTMLRRPVLDAAVERLDDVVERAGPDGAVLDLADAELPDDDTPAPPRLLGMWDQLLLAHADRTRVIDDDHRAIVIRRNGDVLASVLVDGRIRGVWRRVGDGIEVSAFVEFSDEAWAALDVEAQRLRSLLDVREPAPYGSFDRWWKDVPDDHRRLLGT